MAPQAPLQENSKHLFLPSFCFLMNVVASFTCQQLRWDVLPNCLVIHQCNQYYENIFQLWLTFSVFRHQRRFPMCKPHPIHPKTKSKVNFSRKKKFWSTLQHRKSTRMFSIPKDCKLKRNYTFLPRLLGCLLILELLSKPQSWEQERENV